MRTFRQISSIAVLSIAFASHSSWAQQPDALLPSQFTPLTIDQPRAFPAPNTIQARPIPVTSPAQPQAVGNRQLPSRQPPVDVRLVTAEESPPAASTKPPLRLAPRSQLRTGSVDRPAAPTATNAIVTVGGSLCVVMGVFLVVVWCTKRFAPPGTSALPKEAVESLGRAPLTARQQMQLIRVGNKLLLVAITPTGVEPLTEISDAAEVEHLLAICRRGQKGSTSEVFRQTLAELAEEPAPRGFVGISTTTARGGR